MSPKLIALFSIVIASLLWSSAGVTAKLLLRDFSPFALAFWRFFVASICILPFFIHQQRHHFNKKLLFDVFPVTVFGALNVSFFFFGLKLTTANAGAIIYTSVPLIVALLSNKILGESLSKQKKIGLLIGFFGVLIILVLPLIEQGQFSTGDIRGNVLILTASITWSLYTLLSRKLTRNGSYTPLSITTISIVIGAMVFLLFHILFENTELLPSEALTPINTLLVIHYGFLLSVVTLLLYQWGIKHSSAATASLSNYIQPVFGIMLALLFLGETLTWWFVIGSLLVFVGVYYNSGREAISELNKYLKIVPKPSTG